MACAWKGKDEPGSLWADWSTLHCHQGPLAWNQSGHCRAIMDSEDGEVVCSLLGPFPIAEPTQDCEQEVRAVHSLTQEPELVTLHDGAFLDDESKLTCHSIGDGQLLLHPLVVGRCARAMPYSAVGRGAHLKQDHKLTSTSCLVGYGAKEDGLVTGALPSATLTLSCAQHKQEWSTQGMLLGALDSTLFCSSCLASLRHVDRDGQYLDMTWTLRRVGSQWKMLPKIAAWPENRMNQGPQNKSERSY